MDLDPQKKETIGKVTAYFKAILDRDLNMYSFPDRIRLQKLTYILQRAGIDLSYRFRWHIRGPYSRYLADDGYIYQKNKEQIAFSYQLNQGEAGIINKIKTFSSYLENEENSELLASLLYLSASLGLDLEGEPLKQELKVRKPRFSDENIKKALEIWTDVTSR